jgi:hypothetical protein
MICYHGFTPCRRDAVRMIRVPGAPSWWPDCEGHPSDDPPDIEVRDITPADVEEDERLTRRA